VLSLIALGYLMTALWYARVTRSHPPVRQVLRSPDDVPSE
jgi:hypothetical protein